MSITRRLHALLRKILFSWIRVDVLPQNPLQEIDPDNPVLYVLAARGLSELLVGAYSSDTNGKDAGAVYVIDGALTGTVERLTIGVDGSTTLVIDGIDVPLDQIAAVR